MPSIVENTQYLRTSLSEDGFESGSRSALIRTSQGLSQPKKVEGKYNRDGVSRQRKRSVWVHIEPNRRRGQLHKTCGRNRAPVVAGWPSLETRPVVVLTVRPQIQNTSAGLVLTLRPSFAVGDQIEVMGTRGAVLEIGSHSTVLESVEGVRSYIPNTSMLGEMVHVYTASDARRAQFDISLGAGTDIAKALGVISKSLATAEGVLPDPPSQVFATRLDEHAMIVTARFWYSSQLESDIAPVSAAIRTVRSALDEADIELGGTTTALDIAKTTDGSDDPSPT